jgi:glycosidase
MMGQLRQIASLADGMRCDMAHLVLSGEFWEFWRSELEASGYGRIENEFWEEAISAVKAEFPDCVFLAEAYGNCLERLREVGFDFVYDKDPLDRLRHRDLGGFKQLLWASQHRFGLAHFVENHDEPRAVALFGGNVGAANAAAAALLTLPGMRFVNQDQWNGYSNKIDVHLRRGSPENPQEVAVSFWERFFKVLRADALKHGNFILKEITGSDTILIWKWVKDEEHILVGVNFSAHRSGGFVLCEDAPLRGGPIPVRDLLSGTVYDRDSSELRSHGLCLVLEPYEVQIMAY